MIDVIRVGDQDAIKVAQTVRRYLDTAGDRLPPGTTLTVWQDRSELIDQRLELLLRNAAQGGVLVLLALALFLRPSLAFWVALGIPVSFLASLAVLPLLGISINLMSLFAYILVLGIVVDDAIVTGENVFARMQRGESGPPRRDRGHEGSGRAGDVRGAYHDARFCPAAHDRGHPRAILPQTFRRSSCPVLFFSLIESKLVLPSHLSHLKSIGRNRARESMNILMRGQRWVADSLERFIAKVYQPSLGFALRHRYGTLAAFVAIFLGFMGYMGGRATFALSFSNSPTPTRWPPV